MTTNNHKYKLKYRLDKPTSGEFDAQEIGENEGACDALLLTSIIYPEDGSLSLWNHSWDGRNDGKELSAKEMFKLWALLGIQIEKQAGLKPDSWQAQILKVTTDVIKEVMTTPSTDGPIDLR